MRQGSLSGRFTEHVAAPRLLTGQFLGKIAASGASNLTEYVLSSPFLKLET